MARELKVARAAACVSFGHVDEPVIFCCWPRRECFVSPKNVARGGGGCQAAQWSMDSYKWRVDKSLGCQSQRNLSLSVDCRVTEGTK